MKAELFGEAVEARYEAANDAERFALDGALVETVPTSPAGLLAMLEHVGKREVLGDGVIERWQAETLLGTLTIAARRLTATEGHADV
ncbi:hypothetical protein WDZ92_31325 [Nostoc sp. NIES-2111]